VKSIAEHGSLLTAPAEPRRDASGLHIASDDWIALLQTSLEHMDEGFTVFDEQLRLIAWNQRFFRLLDLPRELAYVGAPFEAFMRYNAERGEYGPGEPEQLVRARVELALTFVPHVFERARPDGTVLEVRGNPIPGRGFVTVYKDVTEHKRAERALKDSVDNLEQHVRERTAELESANARMALEIMERRRAIESLEASEKWIRLVADAVPILIGYVDADHVYRFANKHYEDWFGFGVERIIGRSVCEVFPQPLYEGQFADQEAALAGRPATREFALKKPDGLAIEAAVSYLPHCDDAGRVIGYFILGQDLTARKQAERTLRHAQKMEAVGQLTGGIAHDFNNLLTLVIGNLALACDGRLRPSEEREVIAEALDASRRGADLVKRLLSFSRRKPLRSEIYDPKKIVRDMHPLLARTLGDDIALSLEFTDEACNVESDPSELENALLNMAINSRDAMADGGRLTIRVEGRRLGASAAHEGLNLKPGDYVVITVSDTGCGMPPEVKERAFEPFFTSKGPGRGSGLGLSMVYGFAQRSEGAARIESRVGQGTMVELYLPRRAAPRATAEVPTPTAEQPPKGHERVLLVEDDARVRAFAARTLRALGYDVTDAPSGRHALDLLGQGPAFDLLLTDIELPEGISGIELARMLDTRAPATRVLLMSGYPDRIVERSGPWSRRWAFLPKPFEQRDLAQAVRAALDPVAERRGGL